MKISIDLVLEWPFFAILPIFSAVNRISMLTANLIEAELSIAYVHAVAAHSGFAAEVTRMDMDSIDITITANGLLSSSSTLYSPRLEIQLKSSCNCDLSEETIPFDLPIKNYNDLRAHTMVPRLLVLLSLPKLQTDWVSHSVNELILRNCAYWLSLRGYPAVTNDTKKRVEIPKTNVFSQDSVRDLLQKASEQKEL